MTPPRIGPTAVEIPTTAPNIPNARPRSAPRKRSWISPVFCGVSMPAAMPCARRAITSVVSFGAAPASALVMTNAARAPRNMVRRPNASPSRPPVTRTRPNASAYPETTQRIPPLLACSPDCIDGRATLTMLTSSRPMNPAVSETASAFQRRGSGSYAFIAGLYLAAADSKLDPRGGPGACPRAGCGGCTPTRHRRRGRWRALSASTPPPAPRLRTCCDAPDALELADQHRADLHRVVVEREHRLVP